MKYGTLIAAAVATAFALPVAAQSSATGDRSSAATGASGTYHSLDKNRDGFISRDEAASDTSMTGRFSELDKDNDGRISQSEFAALDAPSGARADKKQ
jgi:Ca2+-binding EF-hand superfamily protein